MVSDRVAKLCTDSDTVSAAWDKDPTKPPGQIVKEIFGSYKRERTCEASKFRQPASQEAQKMAYKCGKWGPTAPSSLFLQAFADALNCLDADPLSGVVSPSLMASYGTMPLTVIAPVSDIIRHCSNLIARAERDVFFVTCAWSPSVAQRLIKNALLELSRRCIARGNRVTVHLMYDAPGPANLTGSHHAVKPGIYSGKSVQLPDPEDIPGVDLEVGTLHVLPLGTLHAKFCVVDRKLAAVMSNNMQDNENLEMMVHLEGPIVNSIFDTALITWDRMVNGYKGGNSVNGTTDGSLTSQGKADSNQHVLSVNTASDVALAGERQPQLPEHTDKDPHYDKSIEDETIRIQSSYSAKANETRLEAANRQLNIPVKKPIPPTGPEIRDGEEMTPYISTLKPGPVPMAMVSRPPYGWFGSKNGFVPQNEAWLSLIRNSEKNIFIQTPDLNAAPLLPELIAALKRGVEVTYYICFGYNDLGEMIPGQGGTNDQVAHNLLELLPADGPEQSLLHIYNYVGKDQDHPIHHSFKSRSCHVKLLIVDDSVGVQGSGNQDTQSWFHSQEVNIMVDSREICEKWRQGIERNQNTRAFGRVASDGRWRDKNGRTGDGYMGNPSKLAGLVKGTVGMALKMEGLGGF